MLEVEKTLRMEEVSRIIGRVRRSGALTLTVIVFIHAAIVIDVFFAIVALFIFVPDVISVDFLFELNE